MGSGSGRDESSAASGSGCYRCGKRVWRFGGFVAPPILGVTTEAEKRWWTICSDCGYVEVNE